MAPRRKSTSKKQEEKVEAPKKEVIEPKKPVKAASPKPSVKQNKTVKKSEAPAAKEEPKPQEKMTLKEEVKEEPVTEVATEKVVETHIEPVVEEEQAKADLLPMQEEKTQSKEITVGSTVAMPNGQTGVVTRINKNKFTISSNTKSGRSYIYKSSKISLVK